MLAPSRAASLTRGGGDASVRGCVRQLLADMDDDELSETPSEIAARYAAGPENSYLWETDRDFVRKQRVERWRRDAHAALVQHDGEGGDAATAAGSGGMGGMGGADGMGRGMPWAAMGGPRVSTSEVDVTDGGEAAEPLPPLLLSDRRPTAAELEELLYETSERARDEHVVLVAPTYATARSHARRLARAGR